MTPTNNQTKPAVINTYPAVSSFWGRSYRNCGNVGPLQFYKAQSAILNFPQSYRSMTWINVFTFSFVRWAACRTPYQMLAVMQFCCLSTEKRMKIKWFNVQVLTVGRGFFEINLDMLMWVELVFTLNCVLKCNADLVLVFLLLVLVLSVSLGNTFLSAIRYILLKR